MAVTGDVARVIQRIVLDKERFEVPPLPPVVGGTWGGVALDGWWGPLRVEGPSLLWEPSVRHDASEDARAALQQIDGLRNASATLVLADGRSLVALFGHTKSWGTRVGMEDGPTCEFSVWSVEGAPGACRWVGRMNGAGFLNANFTVSGPALRFGAALRLEGNYTWYLLDTDREADVLDVVIDNGESPLDREALGLDFNALQVALGAPLQLDFLVGLDALGSVAGCAGVLLGGNRATKRRRRADGPVPDDVSSECWIPVFFRRLAKGMAESPELPWELPWGMACNAYLDSISDATIDGRYLKSHVGLEAFAKALLTQKKKGEPRRLVRSGDAWVRWVRGHEPELRAMSVDPAKAGTFVDKVISAMNLPSSGVVADALSRLEPPLVVDETVLDELGKRSIPVHHGSMNKPGVDYEVDRDVQRINILRSLFVALIARASGYDGAIAGWVTGSAAGWKPQPGWWPAPSLATLEEARAGYFCERGQYRPARPRRFQSRFR